MSGEAESQRLRKNAAKVCMRFSALFSLSSPRPSPHTHRQLPYPSLCLQASEDCGTRIPGVTSIKIVSNWASDRCDRQDVCAHLPTCDFMDVVGAASFLSAPVIELWILC